MKDDKNIIMILGSRYAVQITFSNEPAVFISAEVGENHFVHVDDFGKNPVFVTRIENICCGMETDEEVIIFAHLVDHIGTRISRFLHNTKLKALEKVKIGGKDYYIDLNSQNQPAIYGAMTGNGDVCLYHLSEYVHYARQTVSPRDLFKKMKHLPGQVVIIANMLDKPGYIMDL